ncbi:hypothetical protein F383_08845 [Gossypium arboreum]|uniref:Uncharacterized protein n=1 Tax=Gossypium arboreum TaxID=29729 RepID=A0A0B0P7L8_GOSAR|nr:hypothetical protein F383_08845 [Gossypium arboreum]
MNKLTNIISDLVLEGNLFPI